MRVTPTQLNALQQTTDRIRNICILAHVDHGKTTLSDSLVSANGIISEKLAGKIRYLDNTEEEQIRGITMKSSAISLVYQPEGEDEAPYLINLVDSPGHVDFSFDVSTAVRLCDGALVLIDVVEGVCAQTIAVLRQAWQEGIRPCLVINKLDRLVFELQLTTYEAAQLLHRIVEQANAVLSALIRSHVLQKHEETQDEAAIANETAAMEAELLFSPCSGNVLFASATDGWAFNIGFFAQLAAKKLELPFKMMRQALWGEFYYNTKSKKIVTKAPSASSQTLFCSLILDPIWTTYTTLNQAIETPEDFENARKLTKQLRVAKQISDRELRHSDRKQVIQSVMRKWLPLAPSALKMVTRALPNPIVAQERRVSKLCGKQLIASPVYRSMETCDSTTDAPLVIYICKMISVEPSLLSDGHRLSGNEEVYVAVGRVYSGTLTANQPLYVLDPKFQGVDGPEPEDFSQIKHVTRVENGCIKPYMMMGRELHAVDQVPAGNIVGIVGLQDHVLKTATLSSSLSCPSLTKMPYQAKPIVRVAVEPEDPRHFEALEAGLERLYRSDPTVQVHVQETGEHVVVALGELHLERCIKDLKERFAKVAVRVSEPIVGFRESIVAGANDQSSIQVFKDLLKLEDQERMDPDDPKAACGTTADGCVTIKMRAVPLPLPLAKLLEENTSILKRLAQKQSNQEVDEKEEDQDDTNTNLSDEDVLAFKEQFQRICQSNDGIWKSIDLWQIWSAGPRRIGPNLLINAIPNHQLTSSLFGGGVQEDNRIHKLENAIVTGFQLATTGGPLCEEPVWGVGFVVEDILIREMATEEDESNNCGPISGQMISIMKTTCRIALVKQSVRLVEAMYDCTVQCTSEQLGKLYSVLSKRRGNIYSEELSDGTSLFTIQAHIPVIESFGLATDLLIQTSGAASNPQLVFSHWQLMDMDPYFQPQTEEEREDYGERVYEHNYVRKYIEAVRKRKGLASRDEKIVVHAEKQRTLARKR